MDWARRVAQLSHARRLNVGAVIVKDDSVVSYGYNGMPAGWDNNCEYEVVELKSEFNRGTWSEKTGEIRTRPEVMHAERNALDKLARKGNVGGDGAVIFITHAPCMECAKSIYGAGIRAVYYGEDYRDQQGLDFLRKCDVEIHKV
jgi:dCMP deaminase